METDDAARLLEGGGCRHRRGVDRRVGESATKMRRTSEVKMHTIFSKIILCALKKQPYKSVEAVRWGNIEMRPRDAIRRNTGGRDGLETGVVERVLKGGGCRRRRGVD